MKGITGVVSSAVAITLLLGACASVPADAPSQELSLYRAHAGAKVASFSYLGHMDSWKALGDNTIAVWTRPGEAWLIELTGICNNLEDAPFIGLTRQVGQVHTGSEVLVHDPSKVKGSCYIRAIRPLDTAAIGEAEKQPHDATGSGPQGDHRSGGM